VILIGSVVGDTFAWSSGAFGSRAKGLAAFAVTLIAAIRSDKGFGFLVDTSVVRAAQGRAFLSVARDLSGFAGAV
jgi:hypothetical protein